MNGIEFLKTVRTSGNQLPFILFTGRGREEVVIQALNEGADFYLQKGGDPKPQFTELYHKIRQAVQQRQVEEELRTKAEELHAAYEEIVATEEELRQNLDDLRRSEEALHESEESYRTVFQNTGTATVVLEEDGIISLANNTFASMSGYTREEIEGKMSGLILSMQMISPG